MQKKLFLSYCMIIVLVLILSMGSFWSKGYEYIDKQGKDYYLMQVKMLADFFHDDDLNGQSEYNEFVKEYSSKYNVRITLIDSKGDVVADSTGEALDNHATREEVAKALNGESTTVSRYSKTMGQNYSYSAVPVENGIFKGVIRVSLPLDEITSLNEKLVSGVATAIFLSLVLACVLAFFCSRILARPINEITTAAEKISQGDYSIKIYSNETDQIGRLTEAFNSMTKNLKNTVQSLTQRNIELEAMLSSMSSGVVAIDDGNLILFYNESFTKIVEAKHKEINGKTFYSIIRSTVFFDVIEAVRETNQTEVREGILNLSINKLIRITATPVSIVNGASIGVLLILDDITQIRKLENMRSDFVSNVTHELKTPLTSIRGFVDTLKNGAIDDKAVVHKFLDIIDVEAERLYSLIQDILLLSEIESKKDREYITCRVDKTVTDVILLLRDKVPASVDLIYDPEPYVRPYSCNPDRMKQLAINLIDNAIKYTEQGTITITCKEENDKLIIRVADTGIGMAGEHLSRVFERFYRVDKGRARKRGGTGLGLSIVKHIVELYDGTIKVDSKENVGTTFEIRLPY